MGTTLEGIAGKYHAPEFVERRIEDWETRLADLYSKIRNLLPDEWEAISGESVVMYEMIMESAGVEGRNVPTMKLTNHSDSEALHRKAYGSLELMEELV